jgi:hypothetical protein
MPTSRRVCGKGRNRRSTGTIKVEVPKPVRVPTKLAKTVSKVIKRTSI